MKDSAHLKTLIQCDFDGTVTEEDVSFLLLDTYVGDIWREHLKEYTSGKIPVGTFNRKVFGMMKADRETMTNLVRTSDRVRVRPGFREFVNYCQGRGYRVVITSNGLRFYIEIILADLGLSGIDIIAAENDFYPGGMRVKYVGPDGTEQEAGFKEAHTGELKRQGYGIIYIGNGKSDIYPARLARHVFATQDLLARCRQENLAHFPFHDFCDVLEKLKSLETD